MMFNYDIMYHVPNEPIFYDLLYKASRLQYFHKII